MNLEQNSWYIKRLEKYFFHYWLSTIGIQEQVQGFSQEWPNSEGVGKLGPSILVGSHFVTQKYYSLSVAFASAQTEVGFY